ncbi:MAG: type IV toxin-antitoxin system AbiEi family antitoxin domain-containing protein [Deltaproteobacteria bacterium]|nr:type IV toxin-antitoxin system AbiEi family antitoxin domain-containing protein [Deltaproteobacteria bacterium]
MQTISGLGRDSRNRLAKVIRDTKGTFSVGEVAKILQLPADMAAKVLSRWTQQGWVSRVRQGLYVPVPLESPSTDIALEDPWIIADRLFSPGYIGGWSAAEYWELTEQIFRTIMVMTTLKPRNRKPIIKGSNFLIRTVPEKALFGMNTVWRGQVKVNVSDPTRTVLDMLNDPALGGGLRPVADMFRNYLTSKNKDVSLLIKYGDKLGNGAVFKRLGFLASRFAPGEEDLISACRSRLTQGNVKVDPAMAADRLITAWRLWVPARWAKEKTIDR